MSNVQEPSGRPKRLRRKGLIALAAACTLAALAEIGARIALRVQGRTYDSAATVESAEKLAGSIVARDVRGEVKPSEMVLNPFLGYAKREMLFELPKEIAYFGTGESERNYDVLIIGGTFAQRVGDEGEGAIRETLAQEPNLGGRPIRVWSHGCEGYKEPQSVQTLGYLLAIGCKPDAVVLIDGNDELRTPVSNLAEAVFPMYPRADDWSALSANAGTDRIQLDALLAIRSRQRLVVGVEKLAVAIGVQHSAVLGTFFENWMERAQQGVELRTRSLVEDRRSSARLRIRRGPRVEFTPRVLDRLALRAWYESSRSIHAICAEHGIAFVHVIEPAIGDSDATATAATRELEALHRKLLNAGAALEKSGGEIFDAEQLWRAAVTTDAAGGAHTRTELVQALARGIARRLARMPAVTPKFGSAR